MIVGLPTSLSPVQSTKGEPFSKSMCATPSAIKWQRSSHWLQTAHKGTQRKRASGVNSEDSNVPKLAVTEHTQRTLHMQRHYNDQHIRQLPNPEHSKARLARNFCRPCSCTCKAIGKDQHNQQLPNSLHGKHSLPQSLWTMQGSPAAAVRQNDIPTVYISHRQHITENAFSVSKKRLKPKPKLLLAAVRGTRPCNFPFAGDKEKAQSQPQPETKSEHVSRGQEIELFCQFENTKCQRQADMNKSNVVKRAQVGTHVAVTQ